MLIYSNVAKRAKERGISINSLEKEASISRGSISKWNKVSPSVRNLKKVADLLQCLVDDLLE